MLAIIIIIIVSWDFAADWMENQLLKDSVGAMLRARRYFEHLGI